MTRRLVVLAAVVLCAACAAAPAAPRGNAALTVVSTMSVFGDFARAVGGDLVDVTNLVPVGGDPHTYQPAPSDAALITEADVVLDNGLGLSPWFEPLAVNVTGRLVVLTDEIADDAVQSYGRVDPHMWMVPDYVDRGYVAAIERAFSDADPDNAATYRANAEAYRQVLADLDAELVALFDSVPADRRKLVTSHDAYSYFAQRYGLEVVGTVIGVTTEEEPSAERLAALVDEIRAQDVPTVFLETTVNPDVIRRVAADAGVAVGDPLYGDSVGPEGSGADDYVGMMRANARAIVSGLGGAAQGRTG
jgi:ABC-type Zn uptake system ZnuABC Zn-binding protein ZnuA